MELANKNDFDEHFYDDHVSIDEYFALIREATLRSGGAVVKSEMRILI